jgi:hypothetical protein
MRIDPHSVIRIVLENKEDETDEQRQCGRAASDQRDESKVFGVTFCVTEQHLVGVTQTDEHRKVCEVSTPTNGRLVFVDGSTTLCRPF